MKPKLTLRLAAALLALSTLNPQLSTALAQGAAFTYQGRLNDGAGAANGIYDLRFTIYDSAGGPGVVAGPMTNSPVTVSNGLFTVTLDPGAGVFTGAERWLEIAVCTNGVGDFTALAPRQPLTAAPYAILAGNVGGTVAAANIDSAIARDTEVFSTVLANDGSGSGLDADRLDGFSSAEFWKVSGNAGTAAGVNFVGTTDAQPLELRVNSTRALRLEVFGAGTPSLIGGHVNNSIGAAVSGAFIGGGGSALNPNTVEANNSALGGGLGNRILNGPSFIGGGSYNRVEAGNSVIAGGNQHTIGANADYSVITGGRENFIYPNATYVAVGGGYLNQIKTNSDRSVIAGGGENVIGGESAVSVISGCDLNVIGDFASHNTIAGGGSHTIEYDADYATIGGGRRNTIATTSDYAVLAGGRDNLISTNVNYAVVGGGYLNQIGSGAVYATIAGGYGQLVGNAVQSGTIAGGSLNLVSANAHYGTISGGSANEIQADTTNGTIGGGSSNRIGGGAYRSTIGGGYKNEIRTNAFQSTVGGGEGNVLEYSVEHGTISGGLTNRIQENSDGSAIGGGAGNRVGTNADYSVIGGGILSEVRENSDGATIGGGFYHSIGTNADFATIPGGRYAAANNYGQLAYASGRFAATGDAQTSTHVLRRTTTTTNLTELFLDGSSRRMSVPTDGAWTFDLIIIAASATDYAGYQIRGVIGNAGGLVALLGTPVKTVLYESDSTWDAAVEADLGAAALTVKVRGAAGQTIRWVASVRTVELIL
jgi:hypothetical protein